MTPAVARTQESLLDIKTWADQFIALAEPRLPREVQPDLFFLRKYVEQVSRTAPGYADVQFLKVPAWTKENLDASFWSLWDTASILYDDAVTEQPINKNLKRAAISIQSILRRLRAAVALNGIQEMAR